MNEFTVLASPRVWGPKLHTAHLGSREPTNDTHCSFVVEDQGAVINGQPMKHGEEVAKRITSPAPDFVKWARLDARDEAMNGLESGTY